MRSRVPIVAASWLALALPCAKAENVCETSEKLEVSAPVTFGPGCVQDFSNTRTLCAPTGRTILKTDIAEETNTNAFSTSKIKAHENGSCADFLITIRTRDHVGSYPAYTCSPAYVSALVSIKYCE